jgi:hypothetical protein
LKSAPLSTLAPAILKTLATIYRARYGRGMNGRMPTLPALLVLLALGACATDKEAYPSLAIRPGERVSATMQPAAPAPAPAEPAPSAETLGQVGQLRAAAADANRRFQTAAQAAQGPVDAARGAAPGSEQWSVAQVALSDAEARHNETLAALSSLDSLYVSARTEGAAADEIEVAVNEVAAIAEAESGRLDTLKSALSQ